MRIVGAYLKRPIHFWFIILAVVLVLRQSRADDSPFIVDSWSTADVMPQSSVVALTQTRDGYLWLGTLNGLVRFDGNSLTPFNVHNTKGLPANQIVFLFEDSQTNLWVGTRPAGLCLIKNGVVKNFDTGGVNGVVSAAFEDADGVVWFASRDQKFLCWRKGSLERDPQLYPAQFQFLKDLAFNRVVPQKDGHTWQFQSGNVEKWRGETLEKDFGPCPWKNTLVTAVCEDNEGNLIVGTRGAGVFWFDPKGGFQSVFADENPAHSTDENRAQKFVLALCFDREGNLWVGTDGGGLNRVRRKIFSTPAGLDQGVALSAAEDDKGGLWTSFNLQGLSYSLTNSLQHFSIGSESKPGPVLVDKQQQVWAGTSGEGLFHSVEGAFQPVTGIESIGEQIYSLYQDHAGKIWVGGKNGVASYDGQTWTVYSTPEGLPPNAVRALADNGRGGLWIGTEGGGLWLLQAGKISTVNAPVQDISSLLFDQDGILWVGTTAHGLARLQNGQWTVFTEDNGLINDIGYLIDDDSGNLWIGSYEGLMRVEKKSFVDFAANRGGKIFCRTFLTHECSAGAQPSAIRTHGGTLWFPTTEGLVSVNPGDLKSNTNPPPVVIESVLVDGVQQKSNSLSSIWPVAVSLTPENEQLEIHFTALDFSAPKHAKLAIRFRYKLEGYDKNWTDLGDDRVAYFPKLPPGSYVFHVRACNEDGYWNEAGATLAITVEPPFWRRPGFIVVSILVFLGALAGIIYLISTAKLKRELRALHEKELIERERARIARDLHDQLGANLTQVTLLGEMAEADKHLPDEVEEHARQICETARETTHSLDEIVWAVNPANDTLEGLINYACKYAQDYFALAGMSYRAELPAQLPPTPILPEVRHNVFLAFKEAVNNVVKHARATSARVRLRLEPDRFILSIEDNGRGLGDVSGKQLRNGMKNMRKRLGEVRGEFSIEPNPHDGAGTMVQLIVPIARSKP